MKNWKITAELQKKMVMFQSYVKLPEGTKTDAVNGLILLAKIETEPGW